MATSYYESFIKKLKEIFMMDHAELDFGIYRIMNQKRSDIQDFLRKSSLLLAFYFYNHGLQRVWLFLSFSIQRTRCPLAKRMRLASSLRMITLTQKPKCLKSWHTPRK